MIVSSAFFEAVLAIATGAAVWRLWRAGFRASAFGLSFVGLAAALGALLFAGITAVDASHALITQWAAVAGFPAFGAFALWTRLRGAPMWWVALSIVAMLGLFGTWLSSPSYTLAIGSVGLICVLLIAFKDLRRTPRLCAILFGSCVSTALAGLLIGTVGQWGPLPRVDWYHLALTAANLGFAWGLGGAKTSASASSAS